MFFIVLSFAIGKTHIGVMHYLEIVKYTGFKIKTYDTNLHFSYKCMLAIDVIISLHLKSNFI